MAARGVFSIAAVDRLPLGLYFWMNVVMRGDLALLAVYSTHEAGLSVAEAAAGVAYATLVMRFGRTLVAPVLLRLDLRSAVLSCFLLVAAGSALLCIGRGLPAFVAGTTLLGVGFGSCMLAIKVLMLSRARGNVDAMAPLSVLSTALNLGAALGPLALVAVAATAGRPAAFAVACAAALLGVLACTRLDGALRLRPERPARSGRRRAPAGLPWHALALLALIALAFALYSQLYVGLPLVAAGERWENAVGWLFALNAVVVIAVQMPLARWLIDDAERQQAAAAAGMLLLGLGVVVILAEATIPAAAFGVVLFSVGECLALPTLEAAAAAAVDVARLGYLLAWAAAAMGLGESVGAFIGVRALAGADAGTISGRAAMAMAIAVVAVAVAAWFVIAATARVGAAKAHLSPS